MAATPDPMVDALHPVRTWLTSNSRWTWIILSVTLLFTAGVRWRLIDIPLERDEGEYAYAGQLMLEGIPPYKEVYNMKLPGTYAAYALIEAVFGQTTAGIHLGFLLVNAAAIMLVFLLGRRLSGAGAGAMAGASYALMSLSPSVLGTSAHATHFIVLPVLAGTYLLLNSGERLGRIGSYFPAALLFGCSFLMKQHAVFFLLFALAVFVRFKWKEEHSRGSDRTVSMAVFSLGLSLPFLITSILLWRAGVWDAFIFWTFRYAREYVTTVSPAQGGRYFLAMFPVVVGPSLLIWLLAGTGLVALFHDRHLPPSIKTGVALFTICSLMSVLPGLYFRRHYFVTMLPAVALLAGNGCAGIYRYGSSRHLTWLKTGAVILGAGALCVVLVAQRSFFFSATPVQASRMLYNSEPFPESVEIARYLKAHTGTTDRIAVFGAQPELFFYTGRRSATGHIYFYGVWDSPHIADRVTKEIISEIETARPAFIVVEFIPPPLIDWARSYLNTAYTMAGRVDIISDTRTEYYWGDRANAPGAAPARTLAILERKRP